MRTSGCPTRGSLARQTRRLDQPSRNRADPDVDRFSGRQDRLREKLQSTADLRSDGSASSRSARDKVMLLVNKIRWAGLALTVLTAAILLQGVARHKAGTPSNKEGTAAFVAEDEIKKMQGTLRGKGDYQGEIDGVLGLRTRASVRAYQRARNLPITGEVDARTANGLGVRPELTWDNFKNDGLEAGHASDSSGDEIKRDKPSAGIQRAEGTSKTGRKKISRPTAVEDNHGDGSDKQQAASEKGNH